MIHAVIQWLFKKGMAVYRLDERFAAVDRRFDQIDRRFEKIDQRFERLEGRFDRLDLNVADHTRRLDRIETKFDSAIEMRERVAVLEALIGRRPV